MLQLFRRRVAGEPPVAVRYRAAAHVVAAVHGARTVLMDSKRGEYFGVDEVGSDIWSMLGSGATLGEIVDGLEAQYAAPRETLERDATAFISLLQRQRLVTAR